MGTIYTDARLKVDRANKHISDLKRIIVEFEDTDAATIEVHPETGAQSLKHELQEIGKFFDRMSLIAGDAIHNMRTSMDFAWFQTISRCLPEKISGFTKFPVRDTSQQVEDALRGLEIDTRCRQLFDYIMAEAQPYNGGHNRAIWTLHQLDISDKHLLLLEMAPRGYIKGITVRDKRGEISRGNTMPAYGHGPYFVDFEPGIEIHDKGKLSVDISLSEAHTFKGIPIESLLTSFSNLAWHVVLMLENI